jgi:hypothetical protein
MTRTTLAYAVPDLSALARVLTRSLEEHHALHQRPPGHVEMLNLLARAAGYRNLQALQALQALQPAPPAPVPSAGTPAEDRWFDAPAIAAAAGEPPSVPGPLSVHAKKALVHFDAVGRLERWPQKLSVQRLALWAFWTRFDARRVYTEREVNQVIKAWHLYGDHATLRRELINHRLLARKSDCSEYRKLPVEPDDEARALLQALRSAARRRRPAGSARPRRGATPAAVVTGSGPLR